MSDNPFASPSPVKAKLVNDKQGTMPATPPGAVTVIAVLCLILGILGLLVSCGSGVALGAQGFAAQMLNQAPNSPDIEFQKINLKAAQPTMIPNIVVFLINFVVATMLTIGSIGCLRRKEKGRTFLRTTLLAAIFYCVLKAIVTIYSQFVLRKGLTDGIANYDGPNKEQLESLMQLAQTFGLIASVIGIFFALALAGFYFWSRGHLDRQDVISYFQSANR